MPATAPTAGNIRSVGIGEQRGEGRRKKIAPTGHHHARPDASCTFTAHDGTYMDTQDIVSEISELNLT
ncbi:hypothetical protein ABTK21_19190, partial [Acinetobacter baumannii]